MSIGIDPVLCIKPIPPHGHIIVGSKISLHASARSGSVPEDIFDFQAFIFTVTSSEIGEGFLL